MQRKRGENVNLRYWRHFYHMFTSILATHILTIINVLRWCGLESQKLSAQLIKHWNFVHCPEMRLANGFCCCQFGIAQRKSRRTHCLQCPGFSPHLMNVGVRHSPSNGLLLTPNMAGLQHMRGNCQAETESLVRASSSGHSDFWFLPQKWERMWRRNGWSSWSLTTCNSMHQVCGCISHYAQLLFLLYLTIYCSCFSSDTAPNWVAGFILVVLWWNAPWSLHWSHFAICINIFRSFVSAWNLFIVLIFLRKIQHQHLKTGTISTCNKDKKNKINLSLCQKCLQQQIIKQTNK